MKKGWNLKKNFSLIMELFTRVNGNMNSDRDLEFRFGLMELNMKATG